MNRIGKYVVHRVGVTTGYAKIFFCHDPDLQVPVAVKLFDPRSGESGALSPAQLMTRFMVEARAMASFDHPYIVGVKTLEHLADGRPFFVMPYQAAHLAYEIGKDRWDPAAAGTAPQDVPRRVALPRAMAVLKHLASALAALHRRGMVHRAVKPSNILLSARENGIAKLADFSMVKLPERNPPLPDHWIGDVEYCAPEQRDNATGTGPQADVYSLGVLAYRLLTGGLPDPAAGAADPAGVPEELAGLIAACTDPDPACRPAHAGAVLEQLGAVALDRPRQPVQVITVKRPNRSIRVPEPVG